MSENETSIDGSDDPLDALLHARFEAALASSKPDLSTSVIRKIRRQQRRRSLAVAAAAAAACVLTISIAAPLLDPVETLLAALQVLPGAADVPPLTAAIAALLAGLWLQLVLDDPT